MEPSMTPSPRFQLASNLRSVSRPGHAGVMVQLPGSGAVFLVGESEWAILQSCNGATVDAIRECMRHRHACTLARWTETGAEFHGSDTLNQPGREVQRIEAPNVPALGRWVFGLPVTCS